MFSNRLADQKQKEKKTIRHTKFPIIHQTPINKYNFVFIHI